MRAREAVILTVCLGLLLIATALRLNGPPARSAPAEFSAFRAFAFLQQLLAEGVPHPVESAANRVVRDRIMARFRELGYAPVIQRAYSCDRRPRCATVENIVVLPSAPGDVVLGVAHYDSSPNGPGASDDGAGVATMLECATLLKGQRFRNPIGFLITDGEEAGLLGAEAFVANAGLSRNVRAFVNVEDRGTFGASYLFETSRNNRDLVPLFSTLRKPITSSLFYTVYTLLPNDTDVTVFKRAGRIAVNFAAIGGVEHYHKASDDLAHVDMRTLQHHGDNALPMLRALASADLRSMRPGNAVFFDVLGFFVVHWPEQWTIWMTIVSLLVLIAAIRGATPREIAVGALLFVAAIVCAAVIGIIAAKLMPHRLLHPAPAIAAMWIAGIASTLLLTRGRSWIGRAIVWHVAAIALALTLPGVSYLFVVPAIAFAIASHVRSPFARAMLCAPVAALLFYPLGLLLYTALGATAFPVVAVLMAIFASTLAA